MARALFWRFSIIANFLPPASVATGHYSLATRHYLLPSAGPSGVRSCADSPPLATACHRLPNCERSNGPDLAERTLYFITCQNYGLWPCDPKSFERSGVLFPFWSGLGK